MGTHPNGPSKVLIPGQDELTLEQWVKDNPESLGDEVRQTFDNSLPFLFKVLSVEKALSIQAHPNKVMKEDLHRIVSFCQRHSLLHYTKQDLI